jgi:hypothetical protein
MAMERLLMLELAAGGCAVEVHLNGMPLAALGPAGGSTSLAVHEYTLAGRNELTLVVGPAAPGSTAPSQPRIAIGPTWARARLVLVRQGQSPADPAARVLGVAEWATTEGRSYDAPSAHKREVELPVNFPRWRWLDAPPVDLSVSVKRVILEFLQQLAVELGRGNPEPLIAASKLRFDEMAIAYQDDVGAAVQRFRDQVQGLYAAKALKVLPPVADDLVLRPLVDGRLIDCLASTGGPALRTSNGAPELGEQAWPVRLAVVEGRIYVLR